MTDEPPALRVTPPDFMADPALLAVLAALPEARVVGGAVRDALAGRTVADIDLASRLTPQAVIDRLRGAGIRPVPTGLAHGTVTAVIGQRGFEITTLRRDVETDGRHAVVAFTEDWRADAARRDFTINAMSMTPDGAVFDYFGGAADLAAGQVRFVGDPATRLAEDYLRVLRFFRFWARYGSGAPDLSAAAAIAAAVPGLAILSPERVWSELCRILAAPDPAASVGLMRDWGVLRAVLPEGADPARLAALVSAGAPPDPVLRLAALLLGDSESLADRLRLSRAERDRLRWLRAAPPPSADPADLRRALATAGRDIVEGRIWLAGGDPARLAALAATAAPDFPLRGRDLAAAGVPPGPAMGALLAELRAWWLAGGCVGDVRGELARRLSSPDARP